MELVLDRHVFRKDIENLHTILSLPYVVKDNHRSLFKPALLLDDSCQFATVRWHDL